MKKNKTAKSIEQYNRRGEVCCFRQNDQGVSQSLSDQIQ